MKKQVLTGVAFALSMMMTMPVFGGQWRQDLGRPANQNGISNWWYQNDDGSYPANGWYWLDGNQDGWSESYRFDQNGWMYASTTVDQFDVDASGAWTVQGVVQRKKSETSPSQWSGSQNQGDQIIEGAYEEKTYDRYDDDSDYEENQNEDNKHEDTDDGTDSLTALTDEGVYEDWAMACFDLINEEREKRGIDPLEFDSDLQEACNIRAEEIVEEYSHTRPDGSSCFSVLSECGIDYGAAGENIYTSPRTPEQAVKGWMNSTGHRNNILNSTYKRSAVGFYYSEGGTWHHHWVQLFTD